MPSLSPPPKFAVTFLDDDGVFQPAIGYKLYTYAATTSTPKDTYTSFAMGAANTNPIILDARGECDLWLNGSYKFILKDDLDQTIWTVDEIRDVTSSPSFANATLTGTLTISSTAVTWSGNPTHSGNHTFTGNVTINGNTVVGNASSDTLTIAPNAVTWSNAPTHSNDHTFSGAVTINAAATFPLVVTTHTFGAKFGNTARADGSTLDWYEEGTFTPVLKFGGATTGITYSTQTGRFTRVGNRVKLTILIILSSKGSASGVASITGLPYSSHATAQFVNGHYYNMTGLSAPMICFTSGGTDTLLFSTQALATGTPSSATDASFTNTSDIFISTAYEVA